MNILYSILLQDKTAPATYNYYLKRRHSPLRLKPKDHDILNLLFGAASADRMAFIACVVCSVAQSTRFADELKALDPVNTYTYPDRNPDDDALGPSEQMIYDVIPPPELMDKVVNMLDADIRERLQLPTWPEFMGAVALQLLRDNNK